MPLPGQVEGAVTGARGFDSDTVITAPVAQQFFAQGYKFCVRYLSRGMQASGDLSTAEATNILHGGLALMSVQHVRSPNWSPTGTLGQQDGAHAAMNAQSIGFPDVVNVWCDLEGVATGTPAGDVIAYCDAWFTAVKSGGYVPGLYVGANAILSAQQLYDLPFQHYWKSLSKVPDIPVRGYQLVQLAPSIEANGIGIDQDVAQTDSQGGQAQWLRIAMLGI